MFNPSLAISLFSNVRDNVPERLSLDFAALVTRLERRDVRDEKDGEAWSPATYPPGEHRGSGSVESISALVLDMDSGEDPAMFSDLWGPYAHIVHSTHSNTRETPKYRVIFPLLNPIPASDWKEVFPKLALHMSMGLADSACGDAGRLFYLPSAPPSHRESAFFSSNMTAPWLDAAEFPSLETEANSAIEKSAVPGQVGNRPGDEFNRVQTWDAILTGVGAIRSPQKSMYTLWIRPGKEVKNGPSASTGVGPNDLMHMFSSNWAPFEAGKSYSKFSALALLEHGGDLSAAARALSHSSVRLDCDAEESESDEKRKGLAPKIIAQLDAEGIEVFYSDDGRCYAQVSVKGHKETYRLESRAFKDWVSGISWKKLQEACGDHPMMQVVTILSSRAKFDTDERPPVNLRVAGLDKAFYIDLGTSNWEVVEVTANGWNVCADSPVLFHRPSQARALPYPKRGGSIRDLMRFVNAGSEDDFLLILAWLLMALTPNGPYPVLILSGEQGSAKSTTARVLKRLSDPNKPELRQLPKEDKDLKAAATNSHVLAFDNLSKLSPATSDSLCKLSTGGGISSRALYTDDEEATFEGKRPVILTAIEDVVDRPDLVDRALMPFLPALTKGFMAESKLWEEFDALSGRIFGALLDCLVIGLRNLDSVEDHEQFRMADFARFILAAEPEFGLTAKFIDVYRANRLSAKQEALATSTLASGIAALVADQDWLGSATALIKALEDQDDVDRKQLPNSRNLKSVLKTVQPALRDEGIAVVHSRDRKRRTISLTKVREAVVTDVTSSPIATHSFQLIQSEDSEPLPRNPSLLMLSELEYDAYESVGDVDPDWSDREAL
jgi:hypothetical protein